MSLLPIEVKKLLAEIEEQGFVLTLVGGATRDFFANKSLSRDLDFEIRSKNVVNDVEWESVYKKLHLFLKRKSIIFNELPYLITRVSYLDFDLEFSSPRLEEDSKDRLDHHHFDAKLQGNLDYKSSFSRRDFTINAIGIELDFRQAKETLIDPYQGMRDLKNKQLKNINDYFFLDSVRFLRLVRFFIKLRDFKIYDSLIKNLMKFNLEHLSAYHFKSEMKKSGDYGQFFNLFFDWVNQYELSIPKFLAPLSHTFFSDDIKTSEDLLIFTYLTDKELASHVSDFFNFPKKELSELSSFVSSIENLQKMKKSDLKGLLKIPYENGLSSPILREMKNLEDKKRWKELLDINESRLSIGWKKWEHIVVSKEELSQVKPELRSYIRFYKAIENL